MPCLSLLQRWKHLKNTALQGIQLKHIFTVQYQYRTCRVNTDNEGMKISISAQKES